MTNHKAKETIKTIWERYARTLKLLDKALDELDKRPKVPETLEEIASLNEHLRKQIDELLEWKLRAKMYKAENDKLKQVPPVDRSVSSSIESDTLGKDYWGRPKVIEAKPSRKTIQQDDYVKSLTKSKTDNKIR